MKIQRVWAMPNKWTFKIKPITIMLKKYVGTGEGWIDPFSGMYSPAEIRNDLNPKMPSQYHLDAVEFCKLFNGKLFNGILFDPPYTFRQICETYQHFGVDKADLKNNNQLYGWVKDAACGLIKSGGFALNFGYHSNGFGKGRGFVIEEILLIAHGGAHYDTICTVERKIQNTLQDAPVCNNLESKK